jgi:hypothetical protein
VSGAKARVECLLIGNTGRWSGLYAGEVLKARLEASSPPWQLNISGSKCLGVIENA